MTDRDEWAAGEVERLHAYLAGNREALITGQLSTWADWATLLEDPTTHITMTQWARRSADPDDRYMSECRWSFEIHTPEGMKLDASGHFVYFPEEES